jgi:hypothetical protein
MSVIFVAPYLLRRMYLLAPHQPDAILQMTYQIAHVESFRVVFHGPGQVPEPSS